MFAYLRHSQSALVCYEGCLFGTRGINSELTRCSISNSYASFYIACFLISVLLFTYLYIVCRVEQKLKQFPWNNMCLVATNSHISSFLQCCPLLSYSLSTYNIGQMKVQNFYQKIIGHDSLVKLKLVSLDDRKKVACRFSIGYISESVCTELYSIINQTCY